MNKIVFTGGGSAGHVTLNLALIPFFLKKGWQVDYIGSIGGLEESLIKKMPKVTYHGIQTGKLRRYFSLKNFVDMARIPIGCVQAALLIKKINPDIIFSKGGFVSFPVVIGGFICGKKMYMHESDITPGLANQLCLPFVSKFFTTFPESVKSIMQKDKVECVGPVLSDRLFNGNREKGAEHAHLDANKPTIMFIGGSLGAHSLNIAVMKNLPLLLKKYQVIHIAGKMEYNPSLKRKGYMQYAFVDEQLKDLMALSDVVVSRAGSNSIFELASLHKPMILVPLPNTSSRGEQTLNAENFVSKGYGEILADEDVEDPDKLLPMIHKVYANRETYSQNMEKNPVTITSASALSKRIME